MIKVESMPLLEADLVSKGVSLYAIFLCEDIDVFVNYKIYIVIGISVLFEFEAHPGAMYGYYAVSQSTAILLTASGKELQKLLREELANLTKKSPVVLTEFLLVFYHQQYHRVIADKDDFIQTYSSPNFKINEEAYKRVENIIGKTCFAKITRKMITIRAVTLVDVELGVERLHISSKG
jgi:hypothetical protein